MMIWLFRFALFMILFGLSPLTYGGDSLNPILDKVTSGMALVGLVSLVICYFDMPRFYKVMSWPIFIGALLLFLESKYEYGEYVYSYFVIKRFTYCALTITAYYAAVRAGHIRFEYIGYLVLILFFVNQILLGQIYAYSFSSESRTTTAPESLYLVVPFLYFLVQYYKEHKLIHLFASLAVFLFIVILLHRSVISTAVFSAGLVTGLMMISRSSVNGFPIARTFMLFIMLIGLSTPLVGMLPEHKFDDFMESISGILDPKEDNTGSWRLEQSQHYMALVPERPILGWRYEGYDRGEVMRHEDFPDKGTIIHSQYVDQLYNYGAVGLAINLLLILGTLYVLYSGKRSYSIEQLVLFGFLAGGLVYGISYQLPVYYWGLLGLGMFYGRQRPTPQFTMPEEHEEEHLLEPIHQ
ncbi:O-antigen ligase-like membrane protein [Spirosoma oryzae]|uniref:O-antigen ligase-like membrane protein n=1 Tax=Spirosoma oryzae TaxID=1469603 RepID=A0A2T0SWC5_9BACT|nr:O-antigen ligase family protein [Spirosoma oryzae]PRY37663.1 O-antigen ligase-like membrane protein [Spirosoma oryzae]